MNNDENLVPAQTPNSPGDTPAAPVNSGQEPPKIIPIPAQSPLSQSIQYDDALQAPVAPPAVPVQTAIQQPFHPIEPEQSTAPPTPQGTVPDNGEPQKKGHEGLRSALSTIAILLIAPLIAIFLTAFVFQSYQVDGPSMETTLQNNDRLIVWKLPRTWARITGHTYQPNRGDIIIFNEPDLSDYGQGTDKQLIKRVMALPGERIVVKDGTVTVYNAANPKGFQPDKTLPYGDNGERIPNTEGDIDITVPDGQIFVCGDNRPDSLDSRTFGPVPLDNVVGKLAVRVLPLSSAERF